MSRNRQETAIFQETVKILHDDIDTLNTLQENLLEKVDLLFEAAQDNDRDKMAEILGEIISEYPEEEQRELRNNLGGALDSLQGAVDSGKEVQTKLTELFQNILFANVSQPATTEKEIDPLGGTTQVFGQAIKGFSRALLEGAFPKTMLFTLLGGAAVTAVAQTASVRFFAGTAPGNANPCSVIDVNCAAGYWQDMAGDVLGILRRAVNSLSPNASASVLQGQKLCLSPEKVAEAVGLQFSNTGITCSQTVSAPVYAGTQTVITINAQKVTQASCENIQSAFDQLAVNCASPISTLKGAAKNAVIVGSVIGGVGFIIGIGMLVYYCCCRSKRQQAQQDQTAPTTSQAPVVAAV